MSAAYYDGTWTSAQQNGPAIISIDEPTRALIYTVPMQILAANFAKLALDTEYSGTGAVLVHETEPRDAGGSVFEWNRIYAALPPSRNEFGPYVHNAQYLYTSGDTADVLEIPHSTVARTEYVYFHTASPANIPLLRAYKLHKAQVGIFQLNAPDPGYNVERVAEDSTLERWMYHGNIWERKTVYVYQPNFVELVT